MYRVMKTWGKKKVMLCTTSATRQSVHHTENTEKQKKGEAQSTSPNATSACAQKENYKKNYEEVELHLFPKKLNTIGFKDALR